MNDTSPEAERVQRDMWRRMSPAEKLNLMRGLTRSVMELERIGFRMRNPGITDAQLFRAIADRRLGTELAAKVYGPRDVGE